MRAKFKLTSITDHGQAKTLMFAPVTGGSEENKAFWKYTPMGALTIQVDNLAAVEGMKPGQEYYLDFTLAGEG